MKSILIAIAIGCIYTTDCPKGLECLDDGSGRGTCIADTANTIPVTGLENTPCTLSSDCHGGLVCTKAAGKQIGLCKEN